MAMVTVGELFLDAARRHAERSCILHKVDGAYAAVSWAEMGRQVSATAAALDAMGVCRGDRVALIADSGPHWPVVDFATLCLGAVLVPIDPQLFPHEHIFALNDSGARFVFVQGRELLARLQAAAAGMPGVEGFILIGAGEDGEPLPTLAGLVASHARSDLAELERAARTVSGDDLATILYTSGTTANPKGIMLTHRNLTFIVRTAMQVLPFEPGWVAMSFMPVCYIFERVQDYVYLVSGCTVAYAESAMTALQNIQEVRPQVFATVPRLLDRVVSGIEGAAAESSPLRRRLFAWSLEVARASVPCHLAEQRLPLAERLRWALADRLVLHKIRELFGGRLEFCMSGGAPLARPVMEILWGAGIRVFEGYGLTETSPTVSVNRYRAVRLGTVGQPFPGVEVKISDESEILVRGENLMRGYMAGPQATGVAVDGEGWLHTGDIGELDGDRFITITGRKKHVLINSYGRKIVPEPIEHALKTSRFIQEALVVGEGKPVWGVLLVPDFANLKTWAQQRGIPTEPVGELLRQPAVRDLYGREVKAINDSSQFDILDVWELLSEPFSFAAGELTATQKVKRRVVNEKYHPLIERIFGNVQEEL